ncbi:Rrf2 family protein [Paenibacillus favisporus]|uniref:Rrf2 family protein n=1 Tax=Paenibacillus favisporus TaxID=221028 RepID=A0ABV2F548_9BACL
MQFSKSTAYGLHALMLLAKSERGRNVGIKELSSSLGASESYLSKIMSKLRQDGLVRAVTGVNGGYELARAASEITFLDVVQVLEGRQHLYECFHGSDHSLPVLEAAGDNPETPEFAFGEGCPVKQVMDAAELQMNRYLQQHTIQSALNQAGSCDAHAAGKK